MINADLLARAMIREASDPVFGELFLRMISAKLRSDDMLSIEISGYPRPIWVEVIAGGNPDYLEKVAEIALGFFIEEALGEEEMEEGLFARIKAISAGTILTPHNN